MTIAILGTGSVGAALGTSLGGAGHTVVYGSRHPERDDVQALVRRSGDGARATTQAEAARSAEVIILATPSPATPGVLDASGDLSGRILLDATNPLSDDDATAEDASAAARIARLAPGARVVKAFNTTGAENMSDPAYPDGAATMFVAGDDAEAKAVATRLAEDLGFEVVDAGGLGAAGLLEELARLWVHLAYRQGLGLGIAFRLMQR